MSTSKIFTFRWHALSHALCLKRATSKSRQKSTIFKSLQERGLSFSKFWRQNSNTSSLGQPFSLHNTFNSPSRRVNTHSTHLHVCQLHVAVSREFYEAAPKTPAQTVPESCSTTASALYWSSLHRSSCLTFFHVQMHVSSTVKLKKAPDYLNSLFWTADSCPTTTSARRSCPRHLSSTLLSVTCTTCVKKNQCSPTLTSTASSILMPDICLCTVLLSFMSMPKSGFFLMCGIEPLTKDGRDQRPEAQSYPGTCQAMR